MLEAERLWRKERKSIRELIKSKPLHFVPRFRAILHPPIHPSIHPLVRMGSTMLNKIIRRKLTGYRI
jgi:hypothetical protein